MLNQVVLPAGGTVSNTGVITLPAGFALGLVAPAGPGGQSKTIYVNNLEMLGELLAQGYVAIIADVGAPGEDDQTQEVASN